MYFSVAESNCDFSHEIFSVHKCAIAFALSPNRTICDTPRTNSLQNKFDSWWNWLLIQEPDDNYVARAGKLLRQLFGRMSLTTLTEYSGEFSRSRKQNRFFCHTLNIYYKIVIVRLEFTTSMSHTTRGFIIVTHIRVSHMRDNRSRRLVDSGRETGPR